MTWNTRKQKTTNHNRKRESKKNEGSVSGLWDNFKRPNIRIIGVPEGEKSKKLEIYMKK